MFYLGMSTCFHNEALYLPQWLAFHLNMGVEQFFLADHNSTDNWRDAIEPFMGYIHLPSRGPRKTYGHIGTSRAWNGGKEKPAGCPSPTRTNISSRRNMARRWPACWNTDTATCRRLGFIG